MKKIAFLSTLLICMAANPSDSFENLFPLQGLWRMEKPSGPLFEEWVKSDNELLLGKSYVIKGNDTVVLEQVRLQKDESDVYYIPIVKGQNNGQPVTFTMLKENERGFVFENKEHDFPQRVIYRFVNEDSIVARIEGISKGKERASEFYYSRVK